MARGEARGWHPRWVHNEQSMWTPFGTANGMHCALMNEDGMVEMDQGSFSIEPMLWIGGRLITWADVHAAAGTCWSGWMPVPSVIWETAEWRLRIQGEATRSGAVTRPLWIRKSHGRAMCRAPVRFAASVSSDPAVAELSQSGRRESDSRPGVARRGGACERTPLIVPGSGAQAALRSSGFGAMSFDDGFMAGLPGLAARCLAQDADRRSLRLCHGRARLRPIALERIRPARPSWTALPAAARYDTASRHSTGDATLAVTQWTGNGWATDAVHAALTATAHVLVTRSGPASAARAAALHALLDSRRRHDERGVAAHGACAGKCANSSAGTRRISAPTASCPAASTVRASIGWSNTTATENCWR